MNKAEFLRALTSERATWDARVRAAVVDPPAGLKDLVAHVTWYEREMIVVLEARALAGSPLWALPTDERNAALHDELAAANADRSLDDLLTEAADVYARLLAALEALPAAAFADASFFAGMPPDWAPWEMLAGNCFAHYREHLHEL